MNSASIIIVSYKSNSAKLIDCVNSCLRQSYSNFDVILVNNNDENDKFYKYIYEKFGTINNLKIVDTLRASNAQIARNLGLKKSECFYVKFIDDDDELDYYALENLIKCIEKSNAQVVYGNIDHVKIGLFNKIISTTFSLALSIFNFLIPGKPINDSQEFLMYHNMSYRPNTLSMLFDRKFLLENNGWNEKYFKIQDFELVMRLARKTKFIKCNCIVGTYKHEQKTFTKEHGEYITKYTLEILKDNADIIDNMRKGVKLKTFFKFYLMGAKKNSKDYRKSVYTIFYGGEK